MEFLNELQVGENMDKHTKNYNMICNLVGNIMSFHFPFVRHLLDKIIITNNIEYVNKKYGYDLSQKANATTVDSEGVYDIIINYNNVLNHDFAILELDGNINNYIYHELQHVADHYKYDEYFQSIKDEVRSTEEEYFAYWTKKIFLEFNAAYQSQVFCQITWGFNIYGMDSNISELKAAYCSIIENCKKAKSREDAVAIFAQIPIFLDDLFYRMALVFGTNAADQFIDARIKKINISVEGISRDIDAQINNMIYELNKGMEDDYNMMNIIKKEVESVFNALCAIASNELEANSNLSRIFVE